MTPDPALPETHFNTRRIVARIIWGALAVEALLLVLDYVVNFFDVANSLYIRRIFNIAREGSVPTWFSSTQAVAMAGTAALLAAYERAYQQTGAWLGWGFVALFFLYVGIDDAALIHERLGSVLSEAMEGDGSIVERYPSFTWQLFVAPVLAAGLVASALIMGVLAPKPAYRIAIAGGLMCFAVAQGLDFLEGIDGLFENLAASLEVADYTVGHAFRAVEETLEMVGTTAFWGVALSHAADRIGHHRLVLVPGEAPDTKAGD